MKKVYCIEEWVIDCDVQVKSDLFLCMSVENPWKLGHFDIVHEFDEEDAFKKALLKILNGGGVIGKVYSKDMSDDYVASIKI